MKNNFYKKTLSFLAVSSALTMYSCQQDETMDKPVPVQSASSYAKPSSDAKFIDGQYIVIFKESEKPVSEMISALILDGDIKAADIKDQIEGKLKGLTVKLSAKQLGIIKKHPLVEVIEQDQYISIIDAPVGVTQSQSEGFTTYTDSTTQPAEIIPDGVKMVGYGNGTGKTAWVIDSGIDVNNAELNVDVARSKSFLTTTSIQDGTGHGTMVAGIIAAKQNGTGIVGVAANATVVALRVVDDAGNGTITNLIKAVNHVSTNGKAGDVINISLGGAISTTLDSAIKSAASKGIFISIAAGNNAVDCSSNSPQRVNATNVYTISAMDYNKNFYIASNFGLPVDYAAPGVNILSLKVGGGTTYGTGTSFAAPHVAGLLLLKGNAITKAGTVIGDKDSYPDPIAHL